VSLVIPASNEESRLPTILNDAIGHFTIRQNDDPVFSWEIIVVDDGSQDQTGNTVVDFGHQNHSVFSVSSCVFAVALLDSRHLIARKISGRFAFSLKNCLDVIDWQKMPASFHTFVPS
jgi:glycosyltransferase involved in cell wall biosynthesis